MPKPHLPELLNATHGTPVELHAAADAVDSGADHHDVRLVKGYITLRAVISQVEVVGVGRPLRGHRVNLLHHRQNLPIVPQLPDGQLSAEVEERNQQRR